MLIRMHNILTSEIKLFKEILKLEKQKRSSILSADGRKIQMLSTEIEALLFKISHTEEDREMILKSDSRTEHTLDSFIAQHKAANPAESEALLKKSAELKQLLTEIRGIVKENEELLNRTSGTIHKLLKGFGQTSEKQYAPSYMKKSGTADSVLISANA
jgi:hypothetical protein